MNHHIDLSIYEQQSKKNTHIAGIILIVFFGIVSLGRWYIMMTDPAKPLTTDPRWSRGFGILVTGFHIIGRRCVHHSHQHITYHMMIRDTDTFTQHRDHHIRYIRRTDVKKIKSSTRKDRYGRKKSIFLICHDKKITIGTRGISSPRGVSVLTPDTKLRDIEETFTKRLDPSKTINKKNNQTISPTG